MLTSSLGVTPGTLSLSWIPFGPKGTLAKFLSTWPAPSLRDAAARRLCFEHLPGSILLVHPEALQSILVTCLAI